MDQSGHFCDRMMKNFNSPDRRPERRDSDMKLFFDIRNPIEEGYNSVRGSKASAAHEARFLHEVVPAIRDAKALVSAGRASAVVDGTAVGAIREIMSPKEVEVMLIAISKWIDSDPQLAMTGIFLVGKQDTDNLKMVLKDLVGGKKIPYNTAVALIAAFDALADEFSPQDRAGRNMHGFSPRV